MKRLAPLFAVLTACATAQVNLPPEQAASAERRLSGAERFLKVSLFATPFFSDATKKLLTAAPPEHVRLLNNPDGSPINPGPVEATFPVGTAVRVMRLELPTSFTMNERVLFTPRTLAWLYLDVAGTPRRAPPYVLVLRPGLKSEDELLGEVERLLSREDPRPQLEAFSDAVREAVKTKTAVPEMPAEALEMAWGSPERKKIELEGTRRRETWTWADGARTAVLVDGRVTELK